MQMVQRKVRNEMKMEIDALSENEAFARVAVAAFVMPLNPTIEELSDIKTAVSEAVTNAIIHGYDVDENTSDMNEKRGKIYISCSIDRDLFSIEITDEGKGIEDIEKAMEPLFTTRPDMDRSGMGFAFMEAFMDDLKVFSVPMEGTTVKMCKKLGTLPFIDAED